MPTDHEPDESYSDAISRIVEDEPPYPLVPAAQDMEDEAINDPTFPWPEDATPPNLEKRRRGPCLSPQQQMQVAVWIVGGFTHKQALPWMLKEWGFTVTSRTWQYYRLSRQDLLLDAARFLDLQYSRYGYGNPVVRFMKLTQHAELLERYKEQRGLYETETHVVGFGKNAKEVTAERFSKDLSQEWRATMKQIEDARDKLEGRLAENGQLRAVTKIDPELERRFLAAANWKPGAKRPTEGEATSEAVVEEGAA